MTDRFTRKVFGKDAGRKCFAFTKLDAREIRRIKKMVFAVANLSPKSRSKRKA